MFTCFNISHLQFRGPQNNEMQVITTLILMLINPTFQCYEKHKGNVIYFESRRKEVQIEKYTLLTSKQKKAQNTNVLSATFNKHVCQLEFKFMNSTSQRHFLMLIHYIKLLISQCDPYSSTDPSPLET
jgi:hypothetical protein